MHYPPLFPHQRATPDGATKAVNQRLAQLRADIERCHRLISSIGDSKTKENLRGLVKELEAQLRELEAGEPPEE